MKKRLLLSGLIVIMFAVTSCSKNKDSYTEAHSSANSTTVVSFNFNSSVSMDTIIQDIVVVQSKVSLLTLELVKTFAIVKGVVEGLSGHADFAYGVCWGTSPNPTIENYHNAPIQFTQPKCFEDTLKDLKANTTYFVRPYILKSNEFIYGEKLDTFTTGN